MPHPVGSIAGVHPEVLDAIQSTWRTDPETSRRHLTALWESLPATDHFHRCLVAHYLADLQPEPALELAWDRRALDDALAARPESFDHRIPGVTHAAFLPSLHLNLGASYLRVGDRDAAARHALHAREALPALPASPLGEMTGAAILRLCGGLGVAPLGGDDAPARGG